MKMYGFLSFVVDLGNEQNNHQKTCNGSRNGQARHLC